MRRHFFLLALQKATPSLPLKLISPGRTLLNRESLYQVERGSGLMQREFLLFSDCLLSIAPIEPHSWDWDWSWSGSVSGIGWQLQWEAKVKLRYLRWKMMIWVLRRQNHPLFHRRTEVGLAQIAFSCSTSTSAEYGEETWTWFEWR